MSFVGNEFYWGVIVASAAYLLKNFVFDQILEYQKVKGKIRNRLKYYANVIYNSDLNEYLVQEARSEFRQLSCDLEEKYFTIFILIRLRFVRLLFALPSRKDIIEAASGLIYLSNSAGDKVGKIDYNEKARNQVEQILKGNFEKMIYRLRGFFKGNDENS
jgi:hypothetical protein